MKINKTSLSKIAKSKKAPVVLGLFFLVIVLLVFVFIFMSTEKEERLNQPDKGTVLFKIDNQDFYENDIKDLIKYPVEVGGLSEEDAVRTTFEIYKFIVVAQKKGIKPTQEEINAVKDEGLIADSIKKLDGYSEKYEKWFNFLAEEQASKKYLESDANPGYKGYSLTFFFGQHIQYGDDYKPEGLNDPNLIEQDKNYAKQRAEYYHGQLKSGKMKPDQADKEINADPKLKNFFTSKNPFGYDPKTSWIDQVYYPSNIEYVKSLKQVGVSDIQIGKASAGIGGLLEDMTYYFVVLDQVPRMAPIDPGSLKYEVLTVKTDFYYKASSSNEEPTNNQSNTKAVQQEGEESAN